MIIESLKVYKILRVKQIIVFIGLIISLIEKMVLFVTNLFFFSEKFVILIRMIAFLRSRLDALSLF